MMGDGANTSSYFFDDPNDLLDPSTADSHTQADYRGPESDLHRVIYDNDDGDGQQTGYFIYSSRYDDYTDISDTVDDINEDLDVADQIVVASHPYLTAAEFAAVKDHLDDETQLVSADQLDWGEAWGLMSPDYHKSVTGVNSAYNDYADSERVTGSMKNTRMDASCTAAPWTESRDLHNRL